LNRSQKNDWEQLARVEYTFALIIDVFETSYGERNMEILNVYVVYSHLDSEEKWLLMGKKSFDFTLEMAREMGHIVTLIHNDSAIEGDPILEVAIISQVKPAKERIPEINQTCIDFLVDSGFGTPKTGKGIKWDNEALKYGMREE
jgi:hypothetical protein